MKPDAEVSRQRRWQRAMRAEGLCEICGKEAQDTASRCRACRLRDALRRGKGTAWKPGDRGRRPLAAPPSAAPGLGACLRQFRLDRRWTLARMGKLCGVSGATILAIETGKLQGPSWRQLTAIAAALDLPLASLALAFQNAEAQAAAA